jgi:hypothetical protein
MRHHENPPQIQPKKGKLLAFRARPRSSHALPAGSARGTGCAGVERRVQLADQWSAQIWLLLAWLLAASRLHLAAAEHEVFGPEATLAFLLAVVMPIVRVRKLARALHTAVQLLRDAIRARSGIKHSG